MYWKYKIKICPRKGRCVIADSDIPKNMMIGEYEGKLITAKEGDSRIDDTYIFFFKVGTKWMAIDATEEPRSISLGRLYNHSRLHPNIQPRIMGYRIHFFTLRDIKKGEELVFDYGGKNSREHKWLNE